jgi:hypothetical protein
MLEYKYLGNFTLSFPSTATELRLSKKPPLDLCSCLATGLGSANSLLIRTSNLVSESLSRSGSNVGAPKSRSCGIEGKFEEQWSILGFAWLSQRIPKDRNYLTWCGIHSFESQNIKGRMVGIYSIPYPEAKMISGQVSTSEGSKLTPLFERPLLTSVLRCQ